MTEQGRAQFTDLEHPLRTTDEDAQRQVAERTGISRSYVSRIEKKALQKLRHALED